MSGALLGALAVALVAGTGAAAASTLRLRDLPRFVLGAYVLGFAEVISVTLILSAFGAATRAALLIAVAALFAASVAGWALLGAPGLPQVDLGRISALRRAPSVVVLSVAAVLALLYVLALIAGTPPNSHDALTYHLTRAAMWSQGDGVGYITHAYDGRLNAHPANAEIALTFLLETGRNERLSGLVQFASVLMISVGVYALARNLRLAHHEAAFGALLTLTLPVIILQASTAQNDLVAASFLVAAAVFVVGRSGRELFLAALATALAIGTKVPAAYGLVVLFTIALVATPATHRRRRVAAIAGGSAVGSYWFVRNLVRSGSPLGDLSDRTDLMAFLQPKENFYGAFARFLDAIDLSGAVGANIGLYVVVAAAVTLVLSIRGRRQSRRAITGALLTGALIVTPLVLLAVGNALWDTFLDRGGPDVLGDEYLLQRSGVRTVPSENNSWFGPLGLPLAVGVAAAAAVLVRRGELPRLALVLAAAPLAWFVLISLSLAYDTTQGRFFVFPVVLSASLWGLALRVSPLGAAVTAVAVTTAFLSLANSLEKPSGLRLLDSDVPAPVWGAERWEIQSGSDPTTIRGQRLLARLPGGSTVAVALGFNDVGYPAFGPTLEHRVELVPAGSSGSGSSADWLVANSSRAAEIDRTCWLPASRQPGGWTVFRHAPLGCPR